MYYPKLNLVDTEKAIVLIKSIFEKHLSEKLNLLRVSAPLFLETSTGLNDNLSGNKKPVSFKLETGIELEIVQSLAKWKRFALYKYEIQNGFGIYTDMNAIRPNSKIDKTHSIYIDQWDWEKTISKENMNLNTLKEHVTKIYSCIKEVEKVLYQTYSTLKPKLPDTITFITTQELEDMFPSFTPKEREKEICNIYKAVFLIGIGCPLNSGNVHNKRAPDYDNWELNGDILFYHEPLDLVLNIAPMGIRVDAKTMETQLLTTNTLERKQLDFHKMVLNEVLPLSIGGGIGESRLCMFLLEKVHIGEVQVSVWSDYTIKECAKANIFLL